MLKLMVVDDDQAIRESLELALAGEYQVTTCESAEDMLEKIQVEMPDMILLDYRMGKMSGTRALERMGRGDVLLPVVLLSGLMTVGLARQAMKLGAVDCISKPVDLSDLKIRLSAAKGTAVNRRTPAKSFSQRVAGLARRDSDPAQGNSSLDLRRGVFVDDLVNEALVDCDGDPDRAADRLSLTRPEWDRLFSSLAVGAH